MAETKQKSVQESELDLIFAEEFKSDPGFAQRYIELLGLDLNDFEVTEVVPQPQWEDGNGIGDLKVTGNSGNTKIVLLIEHKIDASAPPRQAERYLEEAKKIRKDGTQCFTVMAAPSQYRHEKHEYDRQLDLEKLKEVISSDNPERQDYRRGRIQRAIDKKHSSGVKNPNHALKNLHEEYRKMARAYCREKARAHCEEHEIPLIFPDAKGEYSSDDSWVDKITHNDLPNNVYLRHRMWGSIHNEDGVVDLIRENSEDTHRERFRSLKPDWAENPKGKTSKNLAQIGVRLGALKTGEPINPTIVELACDNMINLADWYLKEIQGQ